MSKGARATVAAAATVAGLSMVGVLVASAVNWAAADQKCGSLFAVDSRFADAQSVDVENRFFPRPVECAFDNGVTLSYRWWPAAAP